MYPQCLHVASEWSLENGAIARLLDSPVPIDTEALRQLLQQTAKPFMAERDRSTPLHIASWHNHTSAMELLILSGHPVDAKDLFGRTPLHHAAVANNCEAIRLLLSFGHPPASPRTENERLRSGDGKTPLHLAVERRHLESAGLLVRSGHPLTYATEEGNHTPLHFAVMAGSFAVVELLLRHGHPVDFEDCRGKTALIIACEMGVFSCIPPLLSSGADPFHLDSLQQSSRAVLPLNSPPFVKGMLANAERYSRSLTSRLLAHCFDARVSDDLKCGDDDEVEGSTAQCSPLSDDRQLDEPPQPSHLISKKRLRAWA